MAVAKNADDYAATRQGIFFPANNATPADGNLTGQCVTLIKWFLAEMTSVPSPFSARGDARYVGDTLVAQGHAVEVPYAQRRRGDIAVYKYGTYGHINLVLSGDRVFEQNANVGGVARRLVDGAYVYAARIGSLLESWRHPQPNIYRIKSYIEIEEGNEVIPNSDNYYWRWGKKNAFFFRGRELSRPEFDKFIAGQSGTSATEILGDNPEADQTAGDIRLGQLARKDNWQGQIYGLIDQVNALTKRPTQEQLDQAQKDAEALRVSVTTATTESAQAKAESEALRAAIKKLEDENAKADETGNAFIRWIGRLFGGGK